MERFESVIDDVKDITIDIVTNGYNDMIPDMCEHLDVSATRIGEEEHFYRFTGPGVEKFYENFYRNRPDAKIIMNNEKLRDEQQQLKKENEELWSRIRQSEEMIKKLECDNTLNKETADTWSREYHRLSIENEKLKKELHSLKQERTNIPKTHSSRSDILDQAKKCVCGHREQDYGTPESNFQLIADLWNGYLGTNYRYVDDDRPINVAPLRPLDVSMLMALLKIARIRNGGGSGDSFVDLAGYAACGGEIWHGERHKDK